MKSYAKRNPANRAELGHPATAQDPAAFDGLPEILNQSPRVQAQLKLDRTLNPRKENDAGMLHGSSGGRGKIVQKTGDEVLEQMGDAEMPIPAALNAASPWAAFEAALIAGGIATDQGLALIRSLYFRGQEQNLPTFQVSRGNWPNIAEHTEAYIDQGEDENGGIVLTYMAARPVALADTNNPAAQARINLGVIATNRDLNRFLSLSRGNRLLGDAHYPANTVTQVDEFPPASTYEGGNQDVSIHSVPQAENAGHGGALGAFYTANGMRDGYTFRVTVVD